jgi:hypothetical protein
LISGKIDRRRRALFWSTIASAAIHLIVLTLLFYAAVRLLTPRGSREVISQTRVVTITKAAAPTPAPQRQVRPVRQHQSAPATTPRHEIARVTAAPASPAPPVHRVEIPSKLERDEAGYAREVAQLNEQNNPHAIPTIDPAARESSSKSYAFQIPASAHGDEHGNGFIFPTRSWTDNGRNCYYGRYEFTYPDGANESGDIVWPFCFDPSADPFKEPPHPIPFPLPLVGFRLPSDTQLPPIEKQVYDEWAAGNAGISVPK